MVQQCQSISTADVNKILTFKPLACVWGIHLQSKMIQAVAAPVKAGIKTVQLFMIIVAGRTDETDVFSLWSDPFQQRRFHSLIRSLTKAATTNGNDADLFHSCFLGAECERPR